MSQQTHGTNLTNTWNRITLWCLNHDDPVPLDPVKNDVAFRIPYFACRNRVPPSTNARPCANRLNFDDYQGIVLKLFDLIGEDPFSDMTNRIFTYKGARQKIQVRILLYTDDEIRLGIRNLTVLGGT